MNFVILGAGAIGSAIAQKILAADENNRCVITYNQHKPKWHHERCEIYHLNAIEEAEYPELAKYIEEKFGYIDVLLNTIGILHNQENHISPEKRLADFDASSFHQVISINVLPTIYSAKYFDKLFNKQGNPILATISAKVGSIEDNRLGGWHSYRASKSCLNMMLRNIAIEWSFKKKNGCVVALHPGTTDSALSQPFQKNIPETKLFSPQKTANYLMDIVNKLSTKDTGKFFSWDGSELPW